MIVISNYICLNLMRGRSSVWCFPACFTDVRVSVCLFTNYNVHYTNTKRDNCTLTLLLLSWINTVETPQVMNISMHWGQRNVATRLGDNSSSLLLLTWTKHISKEMSARFFMGTELRWLLITVPVSWCSKYKLSMLVPIITATLTVS